MSDIKIKSYIRTGTVTEADAIADAERATVADGGGNIVGAGGGSAYIYG
jgi:RPA family protein